MPVKVKWSNDNVATSKEDIDDILAGIMEQWVVQAEKELIKRLKRRKLEASGELLRSFQNAIIKEAQARVSLEFGFEDHGRIRDMRNVRYRKKQPPSSKIEKWIDDIGIQNFKYIPGYQNSKKPIVNIPNAKSRLAYAIARNKRTKEVKQKARSWYNKNFYSLISEMEVKMLESIPPNLLEDLKEAI